jgi:hypothetical protein
LKSHPGRSAAQVTALKKKLQRPLIHAPKEHSAVFSAEDAKRAGLPVIIADPASEQWKLIWRLYAKYFAIGAGPNFGLYEGDIASRVTRYSPPS